MLEKLLNEYAERFNEAFPLFSVPNDEKEVLEILQKCLADNKPYKPKREKDVLYEKNIY